MFSGLHRKDKYYSFEKKRVINTSLNGRPPRVGECSDGCMAPSAFSKRTGREKCVLETVNEWRVTKK